MIKSVTVWNLIYVVGVIAVIVLVIWGQGHAIDWAERLFKKRSH